MLLKNCFTITVLVACSAALAGGCGGLRKLPLTGGDRRRAGDEEQDLKTPFKQHRATS